MQQLHLPPLAPSLPNKARAHVCDTCRFDGVVESSPEDSAEKLHPTDAAGNLRNKIIPHCPELQCSVERKEKAGVYRLILQKKMGWRYDVKSDSQGKALSKLVTCKMQLKITRR
jgi:hypothetical protein